MVAAITKAEARLANLPEAADAEAAETDGASTYGGAAPARAEGARERGFRFYFPARRRPR